MATLAGLHQSHCVLDWTDNAVQIFPAPTRVEGMGAIDCASIANGLSGLGPVTTCALGEQMRRRMVRVTPCGSGGAARKRSLAERQVVEPGLRREKRRPDSSNCEITSPCSVKAGCEGWARIMRWRCHSRPPSVLNRESVLVSVPEAAPRKRQLLYPTNQLSTPRFREGGHPSRAKLSRLSKERFRRGRCSAGSITVIDDERRNPQVELHTEAAMRGRAVSMPEQRGASIERLKQPSLALTSERKIARYHPAPCSKPATMAFSVRTGI